MKLYNGCENTFVIGKYEEGMDISKTAIEKCSEYDVDGLILLDIYNKKKNCIFKMIFYNRDGTNGYMCGNGIRCLMRYAYEEGMLNENELYKVDTFTGIKECQIMSVNPFIVKVNLGRPSYDPKDVEIEADNEFFNKDFEIDGKNIKVAALFLTTHHAVVLLKSKEELDEMKKERIGEKLKEHPFFKKGINVNFVYVMDRDNIFLQTCERGVGYTLACGTGASSSFAVLRRMKKVNKTVTAHFIKGDIKISENDNKEIIMTGRADTGKTIDL